MSLVAFHKHFPKIGQDECRSVMLPDGAESIPPGTYAFVEFYCAHKNCDCRRVMLFVTDTATGQTMASIGYGFDPDDPFAGPILDPLNPQSECAEDVLQLAEELLLSDESYVARLERHYRMFKASLGGAPDATRAAITRAAFTRVDVQERIANRKARQRLLRQLQARKKRRSATKSM